MAVYSWSEAFGNAPVVNKHTIKNLILRPVRVHVICFQIKTYL